MTNPRPLIIAIAFGLIAVVLVYFYVRQVQNKAQNTQVQMTSVVRAIDNIEPRSTIREDMIEEIEIPSDLVPPDAVTESEEIIGKVALVPVYAQQILMNQMFEVGTQLEDLSRQLKEGELAVTIGVTEVSGLGGNLKPGDRVDILATILDNAEVGVATTFSVLRNIGVMAVGQNIGFTEEGGATDTSGSLSKSVTLRVNPKQAEILSLASEVGSLRLALRMPDDLFAPYSPGTALTQFTTYTPTRADLEKAAAAAEQANAQANQPERTSYPSPRLGPEVNPTDNTQPENGIVELEPTGPPPWVVELILGGQIQTVEVPSK
jgi:pilus assembly protein CpaB